LTVTAVIKNKTQRHYNALNDLRMVMLPDWNLIV
jgi:hypothetical protein